MTQAFVMLNVEASSKQEVLRGIKAFDFVEEAYVSYAAHDLIVKVKAKNKTDLNSQILPKIRSNRLIKSSLTLIVNDDVSK